MSFGFLPFLDIDVCYYSGYVVYTVFTENYDLLTIFHKPLWILMHTVNKHLIIEIALHFGDIYDATVCQFLEFGIVDIMHGQVPQSRCGCNGSERA